MKKLSAAAAVALAALWLCAPAQGAFGLKGLDVRFENADGSAALQAGAHPFKVTVELKANTKPDEALGFEVPDEDVKSLVISQIRGLVGDRTAVPPCATVDFLQNTSSGPLCPIGSEVGFTEVTAGGPGAGNTGKNPVYNLEPPPGVAVKLGFYGLSTVPVTVELDLSESPPYNVIARVLNVSDLLPFYASSFTVWGTPSDPAHDSERSGVGCIGGCSGGGIGRPFLTSPRACEGPLETAFFAESWRGSLFEEAILTHDDSEPPLPRGFTGCSGLGFGPTISAKPTSKAAQSPTGLDFSLDVADEGLTNPSGRADSDIKEARVTLPEGMTANPSLAEGLAVCSESQLKAEKLNSAPGQGCPEASKIGSVEVESPLVEEPLKGTLCAATPYENEFGSLIALYVIVRDPNLGLIVRQGIDVEPDPQTGQLVAVAKDIPQLPFSHFRMHFREGGRSPLITPPRCGNYDGHEPAFEPVKAELTPYSGGEPVRSTSTFQITTGPDEGPCPPGGVPPFHPGFEAGSVNNAAKAFSPFYLRLTRKDAEQDMTRFSSILPPGVSGKIAGIARCPDAQIAAAKSKTGLQERANPSCPANSKIGRTLAGAGAGSQLTYVPGSLYLAGPVAGDPLSVVAITPAVAGPYDAGTVVLREALNLNPVSGEVEVDGAHSDPIPHILKGIPLNVRDIRVYADRPEFTLNPTTCAPSSARATLFGSFLKPLDPSDDVPVSLSARYQAASCASLGFKPKLTFKLKGGTRRGAHPALSSTLLPRAQDANLGAAVVTLPHSAFLDQAHIRTICTRVQFAAHSCPAASIYGHAKAWTPLLEEPAEGPVYLRSSSHNLPDLVMALKGPPSAAVEVDVAGRIDSKNGGIRASFEALPDLPVSRFELKMQGGKKGLIINSTSLCAGAKHAQVSLTGQNGRAADSSPAVKASGCGKGKKRGKG